MTPRLQSEVRRTLEVARVLSESDALHFVQHGFVRVREAFSCRLAEEICRKAWDELEGDFRVSRDDPDSWDRRADGRGIGGYVRTKGTGHKYTLREAAPQALDIQADVLGGLARIKGGDDLAWSDAAIGNLGMPDGSPWAAPTQRASGWHKDGWHFRHFLDAPEQGLLVVPIFSAIAPKSGGTFLATDSIGAVAELLLGVPQGIHPDGLQGSGYLIPGLIEQCDQFVELTGEPGDLVIIHPFILHRVSRNPSKRPRFIANMSVVLDEPMRFSRPAGERFSLVELATLNALGVDTLDFEVRDRREWLKPRPFRDDSEAAKETVRLDDEKEAMAAMGRVTPKWAKAYGYETNRG